MKNFIRWQVLFVLILGALGVAIWYDIPQIILANDATHLAFLISGVFLVGSLRTGYLIWKSERHFQKTKEYLPIEEKVTKYFTDACFMLGMIATILGYLLLLQNTTIAGGDVAAAFETMKSGIYTALWGTGVGLISAFLLKTQNMLFPEKE